MMEIRYCTHAQLDKKRWDDRLDALPGGLVYAQSAFLDAMSPGWDALVGGDYEALFPLPWRSKGGVSYVYRPFLAAQLGLFAEPSDVALLNRFLEAIPKKFRYIDVPLNATNLLPGTVFPLQQRANFVLDLRAPYEQLQATYRDNIRRNVRKAIQYGCSTDRAVPVAEIVALARTHADDEAGLAAFSMLVNDWIPQGKALCYGIRDKGGALLASAVFLRDSRRAYYLLVGNHPNGRTLGASHLLLDSFIRDHAGSPLLLDFEGSDLRNLAFFYSSFGAHGEPYPHLLVNRLPWWMRWLKS
ncbi:GNAT family N-acetyltransferase [Flaviaesturariibacter terrae]